MDTNNLAPKWSEMKWTELQNLDFRRSVLVIPVGSIEQHGPHLPLSTDTLIPQELAARLPGYLDAQIISGVPISLTYAPESEIYPGTLSLDGSTLSSVIRDQLISYGRHPFHLIILLNGHMESYQFILEGIRLASRQGRQSQKTMLINWWDLVSEHTINEVFADEWPGWEAEHAALTETSLALYLFPNLVGRSAIPGEKTFIRGSFRLYPLDPDDKPASGSFADARRANQEIGRILTKEILQGLAAIVNLELLKNE